MLKKYSVKILFEYTVESERQTFYELCIRLFHAVSFNEAFKKAESSAESDISEYSEYKNINGNRVCISLYKVAEAFVIYDNVAFEDGAEVFSTFLKMEHSRENFTEGYWKSCNAEELLVLRNTELNK